MGAAQLGADGAFGGGPGTASPLLLPQQAGGSWLEPNPQHPPRGDARRGRGDAPQHGLTRTGGGKGAKSPWGGPQPLPCSPPRSPLPCRSTGRSRQQRSRARSILLPTGMAALGPGWPQGLYPSPGAHPSPFHPVPMGGRVWGGRWGGAVRSLRWAESAARLQRRRMQGAGGIGAAGGMRAPTAPRGPTAGRGVTG